MRLQREVGVSVWDPFSLRGLLDIQVAMARQHLGI